MDRKERRIRTALLKCVPLRDEMELAIPAHMLLGLVWSMSQHKATEPHQRAFCEEVMPNLHDACAEAFPGAPKRRFAELTELAAEIAMWALLPPGDRRLWVNGYLSAVYWLMDVLERDLIVLGEGSPARQAAERIIWAIENDPKRDLVDRSARKHARRVRERLESLGLYVPKIVYVEAA